MADAAPPEVPHDGVIAALEEVWASTANLLDDLPVSDFERPTPCDEWSVRDVVAHMIGTESNLLGEDTPPSDADNADDVDAPPGQSDDASENRRWQAALRSVPLDELKALFRDRTDRRLAALRAMTEQDWRDAMFAPLAGMPYEHVMVVRVLDCWIHEQDIRDATDRPGNTWGLAAAATVDAISHLLGARRVVASGQGQPAVSVTLVDAGQQVREFEVPLPDDRAAAGDGTGSATVTLPVGSWTRLVSGRVRPEALTADIVLEGDAELAGRALDQVRNEW